MAKIILFTERRGSGAVLPQSVGFVAVGLPDSLHKANYRKKHSLVLLTSGAYLRFCAEVPYILAPKNKNQPQGLVFVFGAVTG